MFGVSKTQAKTGLFENLKIFYPPEGGCESNSQGVHLMESFLSYLVKETNMGLFFPYGDMAFFFLEMFYLRVGWTEYQKCPSIFFILCGYIGNVYTYI